ncbi:MAG: cobalt-precorrin 5A hydrolase [Eubacteriales bacterium]|nr:cobalt-precorrin 5A hydrolase [Eubacteriales bacterium]
MTTAYFYLTAEGESLAHRLAAGHPGDLYGKENFKENLRRGFSRYDYLVCIMATGIVVRILAPLITHKTKDPGVVVLDQRGRHAISLLSGHLGGANELARKMALLSGGEAVITTATDVAGELSFDTFAQSHGIAIENIEMLKHISGAFLDGQPVRVITDKSYPELTKAAEARKLILHPVRGADGLSEQLPTVVLDEGFSFPKPPGFPVLYLRPRTICAGIGCKRNADGASIEDALLAVLKKEGLSPLSLKCISTIPLKADEPGIHFVCERLSVPLTVIPPEEIKALDIDSLGIQTSSFVAEQTGLLSVSTASSYLASGKGRILKDKVKFKGITVALSQTMNDA